MTRLEERYRRVLRLLPASYREVWEEDMVSAFLASVHTDDAEQDEFAADFGWPERSEVASIAVLAVRLRVGNAGAPPRYAAWNEAIRLSVLTGLLVNAAASTVGAVVTLWLAGIIPLAPAPVLPEPPGYPDSWHLVSVLAALAGLLWLPAFLALVSGRWAAARRFGWAAAVAGVVSAVVTVAVVASQPVSGQVTYLLLINVLLVLGLAAFHHGAAPVRPRSWLRGLGLCTVLVAGHTWLQLRARTSLPPLDWAGLWCVVLVAAAVVHVAGRALKRQGRQAWTLALAILAFTVLGLRLATLLDYARIGSAGWHPATVPLGIAEAVAVAAAGVLLAWLSARALRRLPAAAGDATAWSTPSR